LLKVGGQLLKRKEVVLKRQKSRVITSGEKKKWKRRDTQKRETSGGTDVASGGIGGKNRPATIWGLGKRVTGKRNEGGRLWKKRILGERNLKPRHALFKKKIGCHNQRERSFVVPRDKRERWKNREGFALRD